MLYPAQGLTKADLAFYYGRVAPFMLPHLERRVLSLVRCPEGQGAQCFFQKHPSRGVSEAVRRLRVRERAGFAQYMYVEDLEGLMALVQLGALEIHAWGSRVDALETPDQLVFDLDPDASIPWSHVVEAAQALRALLSRLDLPSFVKTTGGKGLHVVVPIAPRSSWDEAKAFTRAIAERLVRSDPERYVATMSKAKRTGKIFLDYLRNTRGATAICPYSTRAKPGATVATPITWEELDAGARAASFVVTDLPARLSSSSELPWARFGDSRPRITAAMLRAVGARSGS